MSYVHNYGLESPPGGYAILKQNADLKLCMSQKHPETYLVLVLPSGRFGADDFKDEEMLKEATLALIRSYEEEDI